MKAALRTLLLTDLVDSTALVRRLGDARAAELSARHDALARDLLPPWRGREIDKTDGFLLLFDTADDGVGYALAYHAALEGLSAAFGVTLAARAGLHTASVVLRENPPDQVARGAKPLEVEGVAKPIAARVTSVAGAGQTLLTQAAHAALSEAASASWTLASHGHWRLKGIDDPMELFGVAPEDGTPWPPADAPKAYRVVLDGEHWTPLRDVPNNLPTGRRRAFGREAELRALQAAIAPGRLVCVVGPREVGRTDLALTHAHTFRGDWSGGTFWVDARQVVSGRSLQSAVDAVLDGVKAPPSSVLLLLDRVRSGPGVGEALTALADRGFALVVTSEAPFGRPGERVVELAPFPLPDEGSGDDQPCLAVVLAAIREQDPGFTFDPDSRARAVALAAALGGLPGLLWRAGQRGWGPQDGRPFRGLAAFDHASADLFFGREEEEARVARAIVEHPMVTVTGASGVGKSSLLRAGVSRHLPGFAFVFLRPGIDPLAALELALDGAPADRARVVVVDQAEELLTLSRRHAADFAARLVELGAGGTDRVVLTVRGDFFARLAELAPLRGVYSRCVEVLTPPTVEAGIRTLVQPAARFGVVFDDPDLPAEMVRGVADESAALALLQFCADQLWEARDQARGRITRAAYEAMGGVAGALARHADRVHDQLDPVQRREARRILLRLVTADLTRAPRTRADLVESASDPEAAARVIDHLTDARLLSVSSDAEAARVVELAHEALIRHWQRLAGWLAEDEEAGRMARALAEAVGAWERADRSQDLLWRGGLLAELRTWRQRVEPRLTRAESAFVDDSERLERRGRALRAGLLTATVAALVVGLVVMEGLRRDAERAAAEARVAERIANTQLALGAGDHVGAIEDALGVWQDAPDTEPSRTLLHRVLAQRNELSIAQTPAHHSAALSPTGDRYVGHGPVSSHVYDDRGRELWEVPADDRRLNHVQWAPDGQGLYLHGGENRIHALDLDGTLRWRSDGWRADYLVQSRDGRLQAWQHYLRTDDPTLRVTDLEGHVLLGPVPLGTESWPVGFNADHTLLSVWDPPRGNVLVPLADPRGETVLFEPCMEEARWHPTDPHQLLGWAEQDCPPRRVDVRTRQVLVRAQTVLDHVQASPGGEHVVTWDDANLVILRGHDLAPLDPQPVRCPLVRIEWSSSTDRMAWVCDNGEVWVYPTDGGQVRGLVGHESPVHNVGFWDEGALTWARDGTLRRWRTDGSGAIVRGFADVPRRCLFDPTGARLTTLNQWRQGQVHDRQGRWLAGHPKDRVHTSYDIETLDRPHQDPITTWSWDGAWGAGLRWEGDTGRPFVTDGDLAPRSDLVALPAEAEVVAAHPRRDVVLVAGPAGAGLYELSTDRFTPWPDSAFDVVGASWDPSGERVLLVRPDRAVQVRDAAGVVLAEVPARVGNAWRAAWSADGSRWTLATFERTERGLEAVPDPLSLRDREGRELATAPEGFYGWVGPRDVPLVLRDGQPVLLPPGADPVVLDGPADGLKLFVDPSAPWVLTTHGDGKALLWTDGGERVADLGNTQDQPTTACFDPRGELVVLGTELGHLRFVPLSDEALVARARDLVAR